MGKPFSLGAAIAKANREFKERLGIAGDDQVSRVRRRLLQPLLDDAIRAESERIMAEMKARSLVDTGALRRRP